MWSNIRLVTQFELSIFRMSSTHGLETWLRNMKKAHKPLGELLHRRLLLRLSSSLFLVWWFFGYYFSEKHLYKNNNNHNSEEQENIPYLLFRFLPSPCTVVKLLVPFLRGRHPTRLHNFRFSCIFPCSFFPSRRLCFLRYFKCQKISVVGSLAKDRANIWTHTRTHI